MALEPNGRPGKTAPKLKHDFLFFDPIRCSPISNYLADFTPPVGEGRQLAPEIGSCKHEYTVKTTQSELPPLDLRPDGASEYKAALICKKCRIHADVHIAYPHATNPCPNSDYELHHFQRLPGEDERGSDRIVYGWVCSAPECRAKLRITFRLSRIQQQEKDLLTNTELLKQRYEALVKDDPNREGLRQASPMDALNRLRRYIKDSLAVDRPRKSFPANNKRFQEAFGLSGRDCYTLLQKLGFTYVEAQGQEIAQWTLPTTPQIEDRLQADGSSPRELLEDFEMELLALMCKQASDNPNLINPAASEGWPTADGHIERVLAAQGYPRYSSLRRAQVSNEELPFYASLGALPDFADRLIEFCFDRQCLCDPERRSYYFECLQVVNDSRPNSESLQVKVATMSSQDLISRRDLAAAYRHLNLDRSEVDEERIVNLFASRISDLGKEAQEEARQALYKIGVAMGSQHLIKAAKQTLETYEDALAWLSNGVNKSTSDDGLLAVLATKDLDNPETREIATKAISIIARERSSNTLNDYLLKGPSNEYTMGVEEALRLVGVDDKWENIDKSMLPILFDSARADRPGEQIEKAIKTLEQAMAGNIPTSQHSPDTWPVGLTSHGNTCYLNSLLQYYFSIKPLREIVLDYDKYKLDTTVRAQKEERVGQRILSEAEISGGQKFAEDLKHLFERMIKASGEHVKPSEDLVCRTFLDIQDYKLLGAKSTPSAPDSNGQDNSNATGGSGDGTAALATPDLSDASSRTLQASTNGDDADTKMNDSAVLTPPTSPKQQSADVPPLPPRPAPRRFSTTREVALDKAEQKARAQQDVTEAHDLVMFRLRAGMTPKGRDKMGEQIDDLANLFKITLSNTPVKEGVDGKPQLELDSSITSLVPNETTDIYNLLDGVFDLQPSGAAGVELYKTLTELPPLFQINIPRINWDAETGNASKSDACVKLPDELYLDRYCDNGNDQVLQKRKACWGWRKQLHALRKEQQSLSKTSVELDGPTAVSESAKFLSTIKDSNAELEEIGLDPINFNSGLCEVLSNDATQQTGRLVSLEKQITEVESRLRGNFDEMRDIKYRLAAVFIHRGNTGHGHYWIYIHDFDKDIWRSYNDERVEEFTKLNEIYEANNWNHGTPTYAVYVRDEHKTDIISPVCRAPEEPPVPEPNEWRADEVMQNGTDDIPPLESVDPKVTISEPAQVGVGLQTVGESTGDWDEPREVASDNHW